MSRQFLPPLILVCEVRELVVSVRRVEQTPTASGDTPISSCVITACGQLQPDDPSLTTPEGGAGTESEDRYEDFPEDEERVDISKPDVALQVNRGYPYGSYGTLICV